MMVGDLPSDGKRFGIPSADMLQDALNSFKAEQAVLLNERLALLLKCGENRTPGSANAEKSVPGQAAVEKQKLDDYHTKLLRLRSLMFALRAIIFLTTNSQAKAELHFPALRMKLPYATALVLSMVGSDPSDKLDAEATVTLAAFNEFYGFLKSWEVI